MATEYWPADDDVTDIAEEVITAHHPDLSMRDVVFVMRSKAAKSCHKITLAKAAKLSEKQRALMTSEALFVIEIADDEWQNLNDKGRRALLDHELCHCAIDEEEGDEGQPIFKARMRKHDLEEFAEIVRRHGAWRDEIREVTEQLKLFDFESIGGDVEKPILKRVS